MEITHLIQQVKSGVCSMSFINPENKKIGSGSGFLSRNKLITNNHVLQNFEGKPFPNDTAVHLRIAKKSNEYFEKVYLYEDFIKNLVGSDKEWFDYAILEPNGIQFNEHYEFELGSHKDVIEGEQILVMGFPFGSSNLTCHTGYVSSIYNDERVDIIQLDASINRGNSGGPAIDLKTGKAVGVVTRKITGLSDDFDQLYEKFRISIDAFSRYFNMITLGEKDDLIRYLVDVQKQMKVVHENLSKTANTGIGSAFSCYNLEMEFQ